MSKSYIELELQTNYNGYHYSEASHYESGDIVEYKGALYRCIKDCIGECPINSNSWRILA